MPKGLLAAALPQAAGSVTVWLTATPLVVVPVVVDTKSTLYGPAAWAAFQALLSLTDTFFMYPEPVLVVVAFPSTRPLPVGTLMNR
jgi:hypothetical protein